MAPVRSNGRRCGGRGLVVVLGVVAALLPSAAAGQSAGNPSCGNSEATIVGTDGPDELTGTSASDVIVGLGGHDVIDGLGGDDVICAGAGDDSVFGGAGDDLVYGEQGRDALRGGVGSDSLIGDFLSYGGAGDDDRLWGGPGDDDLIGGRGTNDLDGGDGDDISIYVNAETAVHADLRSGRGRGAWGTDRFVGVEGLFGGAGDDTLIGDAGTNLLSGYGGDDLLVGKGGMDALDGEGDDVTSLNQQPGNDVLRGGAGPDVATFRGVTAPLSIDLAEGQATDGQQVDDLRSVEGITASPFNDVILGDDRDNYLFAGGGNDFIDGRGGGDYVGGGPGDDVLIGSDGIDFAYYGDPDDNPTGVDLAEGVAFGNGDDQLFGLEGVQGSGGDDILLGDEGANYFLPGGGNDQVDGRGAQDLVSYFDAPAAIEADLAQATVNVVGTAEQDLVINIEALEGSDFDDTMTGGDDGEYFKGGPGGDTISGRGGADWFIGDGPKFGESPDIAEISNDDIDGGASSFDLVSYEQSGNAVDVNLRSGQALGEGTDRLTGVEAAQGSRFDDRVRGNGTSNALYGHHGNDRVVGRGGADELVGGSGADLLRAGGGADNCVGGEDTGGCEVSVRPRTHPLRALAADWERHRIGRRLKLLARFRR